MDRVLQKSFIPPPASVGSACHTQVGVRIAVVGRGVRGRGCHSLPCPPPPPPRAPFPNGKSLVKLIQNLNQEHFPDYPMELSLGRMVGGQGQLTPLGHG